MGVPGALDEPALVLGNVVPWRPTPKLSRVDAPVDTPPLVVLPGFGNCSKDYECPNGNPDESMVAVLRVSGWISMPVFWNQGGLSITDSDTHARASCTGVHGTAPRLLAWSKPKLISYIPSGLLLLEEEFLMAAAYLPSVLLPLVRLVFPARCHSTTIGQKTGANCMHSDVRPMLCWL